MSNTEHEQSDSLFHEGEKEMQSRVGKRDAMEVLGPRMIRDSMPEQHRKFYEEQYFLVFGSADSEGWPWASIVSGEPGFAQSPDPDTLRINTRPLPGDPLASAIKNGSAIGMLGIQLATRRRNRLNGRISQTDAAGFTLAVDQAFGNCPKYIQTRSFDFHHAPNAAVRGEVEGLTVLDAEASASVKAADTFFVSSYVQARDRPDVEGVDVSHRGGCPGFVKVAGNTLTVPDYSGNSLFNTLGNFLVNPQAGLTFVDFETGDLLMLSGTVEVLGDDEPEVRSFKGAERAWRFTLHHGKRRTNALPFRATLEEYFPSTMLTGDWEAAAKSMESHKSRKD